MRNKAHRMILKFKYTVCALCAIFLDADFLVHDNDVMFLQSLTQAYAKKKIRVLPTEVEPMISQLLFRCSTTELWKNRGRGSLGR